MTLYEHLIAEHSDGRPMSVPTALQLTTDPDYIARADQALAAILVVPPFRALRRGRELAAEQMELPQRICRTVVIMISGMRTTDDDACDRVELHNCVTVVMVEIATDESSATAWC